MYQLKHISAQVKFPHESIAYAIPFVDTDDFYLLLCPYDPKQPSINLALDAESAYPGGDVSNVPDLVISYLPGSDVQLRDAVYTADPELLTFNGTYLVYFYDGRYYSFVSVAKAPFDALLTKSYSVDEPFIPLIETTNLNDGRSPLHMLMDATSLIASGLNLEFYKRKPQKYPASSTFDILFYLTGEPLSQVNAYLKHIS